MLVWRSAVAATAREGGRGACAWSPRAPCAVPRVPYVVADAASSGLPRIRPIFDLAGRGEEAHDHWCQADRPAHRQHQRGSPESPPHESTCRGSPRSTLEGHWSAEAGFAPPLVLRADAQGPVEALDGQACVLPPQMHHLGHHTCVRTWSSSYVGIVWHNITHIIL